MQRERKIFEEMVEARLHEWDTNLKQLRAMRDVVKGDAKITYEREIEWLEHKRNEVLHKLDEFRSRESPSRSKAVIDEIEHSVTNLGQAFDQIYSRLKSRKY